MIYATVRHSDLSETGRLEAGYFLNEDSINTRTLRASPVPKAALSDLATIFNPPVFKRTFCANTPNSVEYFQSSDVPGADSISDTFIPRAQAEKVRALVQEGSILLTGYGAIGNTRLVTSDIADKAFADNVCRVIPHKFGGYLYAFLATKYSRSQLNQNASGSVVRFIKASRIGQIIVPLLPVETMEALDAQMQHAGRLRAEAAGLLQTAIQSLEDALPEYITKNIYTTPLSSFQNQRLRLDATVQHIAYQNFLNEASKLAELRTLEEISGRIFTPGIFKRMRVHNIDNGVVFLSGTNLLESRPILDSFLSHKTPNLPHYILREGWLALQDSGSLSSMGYVSLVPRFLNGAAATNNLVRVLPGEVNYNPYLLAFFRTRQGQRILKNLSYGTGQLHIDNVQIAQLKVPIFKKLLPVVTEQITGYVQRFAEAYDLETTAIQTVETYIGQWQPS